MFSVFLRFLWGWRGGLRGPPPPSPPPVPPRPFIAYNAASGGEGGFSRSRMSGRGCLRTPAR